MCESLEHRGPLFRFIAPRRPCPSRWQHAAPQGQQLVDLCEGVFLRGPSLVEPERAECIEGICIQVRKCFPLLPEALRHAARSSGGKSGWVSRRSGGAGPHHEPRQRSRGPWAGDAVEALERIQGRASRRA